MPLLIQSSTSFAMSISNCSSPSDAHDTANWLNSRKVGLAQLPLRELDSFRDVWDKLVKLLGCDTLMSSDKALNILKPTMTDSFLIEKDFNDALCAALKRCFRSCQVSDNDPNNLILRIDKNDEYGFGIARNPESKQFGLCSEVSGFKPDHSFCLFKKDVERGWIVMDCFSVVELKLSGRSCGEFPEGGSKIGVLSVDFRNHHTPLGQVIAYTLRCTWPCHARRGILPQNLPLAVIAGRSREDPKKVVLRWVWGELIVPDALGNQFKIGVNNFGGFHDTADEKEEISVMNALALYLDTLAFGLKAAKQFLEDRTKPPLPMSGKALMFGTASASASASLGFCASPSLNANHFQNATGYTVTQGELFKGKLNVCKALSGLTRPFVAFKPCDQDVDVIVKVSSKTVHPYLVNTSCTFAALERISARQQICALGTLETIKRKQMLECWENIGDVLYAAILMQVGLVTIMKDLTHEYHILTPEAHKCQLGMLWSGFSDLVTTLLLPLADSERIIYPDIRPGFDLTSNILCKFEDNKAIMRLIDYESLVVINNWIVPGGDSRYIECESEWDATTYVMWQCITIAHAWTKGWKAKQYRNCKSLMQELLLWSPSIGIPNFILNKDMIFTEVDVKAALDAIANSFVSRE